MNLVTGATGIVGIHTTIELLRRGEKVRALCRSTSNKEIVKAVMRHYGCQALFAEIEWHEGDMLDYDTLLSATSGIRRIYHTAAMVSFACREHALMWQTNVEGTRLLIEAAIANGVESICHVSSIGATGHTHDGTPIDETTPWQPEEQRTVYSQSKFRQEMEVWQGHTRGLKAVVVNPGVVLGPGEPKRSSNQITATVQRGTRFYTQGHTGYIDARDLAYAMVELANAEQWGERFIAVGTNAHARQLQTLFAQELRKPRPTTLAPRWLMYIVAAAAATVSFITRSKPAITFESVRAMGGNNTYSSRKLNNTIHIQYTSLADSVKNMVSFAHKLNK